MQHETASRRLAALRKRLARAVAAQAAATSERARTRHARRADQLQREARDLTGRAARALCVEL